MNDKLNEALKTVEMTYGSIKDIANSMLSEAFASANAAVEDIQDRIEVLSVDEIRNCMLKIQLAAFSLSELRDRTATKAACAEAVRKEAYATSYIGQAGTQNQRESNATLEISENIVAQCLYDLVASLVKSKVDQCHRMVDVLKSILMSKMQEAKIVAANMAE